MSSCSRSRASGACSPSAASWLVLFIGVLLLTKGCTSAPEQRTEEDSTAVSEEAVYDTSSAFGTADAPRHAIPADTSAPFRFRPEAPPPDTVEGVRIATLNAEFLFDGYDSEGQATFPWKGDPEAAREHRARIGQVLRMLDADLVMLQEIENETVLDSLLSGALADMDYEVHFVQGNDRFTGQDVALLARLPVEETGRTDERAPVGRTDEDYGVSKNMYARLDLHGIPATLIGMHFLARPDDPGRQQQREAQAEVIRRLVVEEMEAGRAPIVLGDFNDFDDEILDAGSNRPITRVLARIKEAGPGPEDNLYNVMAEAPHHERFTAFYDRNNNGQVDGRGELSALDHILLGPSLRPHLRSVQYVQAHDPAAITDHFPIVITLDPQQRNGKKQPSR